MTDDALQLFPQRPAVEYHSPVLQGELMMAAGGASLSHGDPQSLCIDACTSVLSYAASMGIDPVFLIESATALYHAQSSEHLNTPAGVKPGACDKPFVPSREVYSLLLDRLNKISMSILVNESLAQDQPDG